MPSEAASAIATANSAPFFARCQRCRNLFEGPEEIGDLINTQPTCR